MCFFNDNLCIQYSKAWNWTFTTFIVPKVVFRAPPSRKYKECIEKLWCCCLLPLLQSIFISKEKQSTPGTPTSWDCNFPSYCKFFFYRCVLLRDRIAKPVQSRRTNIFPPSRLSPLPYICLPLPSSQPGQSSKTNHQHAPSALCCSPEEATDEGGRLGGLNPASPSLPHSAGQRLVSDVECSDTALPRTG